MINLAGFATRAQRVPMSPAFTPAADTFLAVTFPVGGADA
jgi:hypothetical protein